MKHWKTDRYKWLEKHPYPENGFGSLAEAQDHCRQIRQVHTDKFTPLALPNGRWTVEQDIQNAPTG